MEEKTQTFLKIFILTIILSFALGWISGQWKAHTEWMQFYNSIPTCIENTISPFWK